MNKSPKSIQAHSFTHTYNGFVHILKSEVFVRQAGSITPKPQEIISKHYFALWDTGASNSVITKKVVKECELKPTGRTIVHHGGGSSERAVFLVDILLPNSVTSGNVKVSECDRLLGDMDVLIGMDIIILGDFAITNSTKRTIFTFRIPSVDTIDFAKDKYIRSPSSSLKLVGRNSPCTCGSGKKYKNCCG